MPSNNNFMAVMIFLFMLGGLIIATVSVWRKRSKQMKDMKD
jgi:hypothetical protein